MLNHFCSLLLFHTVGETLRAQSHIWEQRTYSLLLTSNLSEGARKTFASCVKANPAWLCVGLDFVELWPTTFTCIRICVTAHNCEKWPEEAVVSSDIHTHVSGHSWHKNGCTQWAQSAHKGSRIRYITWRGEGEEGAALPPAAWRFGLQHPHLRTTTSRPKNHQGKRQLTTHNNLTTHWCQVFSHNVKKDNSRECDYCSFSLSQPTGEGQRSGQKYLVGLNTTSCWLTASQNTAILCVYHISPLCPSLTPPSNSGKSCFQKLSRKPSGILSENVHTDLSQCLILLTLLPNWFQLPSPNNNPATSLRSAEDLALKLTLDPTA